MCTVCLHFQQLVGSLPLVMMFDMPDGIEMVDSEVQKIGEELDVAISIKPKHRQGSKSVLIKAQERSASSIYSARHRLLKVDQDHDEEALVVAEIPETYKIQPIPPHLLQSLGGTLTYLFIFNISKALLLIWDLQRTWRFLFFNYFPTHPFMINV